LQSGRHKVVDQLIADIPTRPPTDHVGDDGTGIVRLGEGEVRDEWLSRAENLAALADLPGQWIDKVHHRRPPKTIVLDMASSESPTYGDQEGSAYNGHFGCTCYHPAFVFNQLGDVYRCAVRGGNMHSADGWRVVLEPVIARYWDTVKRLYNWLITG
jgi:Transposase DDE domain group 1